MCYMRIMIVLQVGALERVFPQILVTASCHNFTSVHCLTITITRACRREDFFSLWCLCENGIFGWYLGLFSY